MIESFGQKTKQVGPYVFVYSTTRYSILLLVVSRFFVRTKQLRYGILLLEKQCTQVKKFIIEIFR